MSDTLKWAGILHDPDPPPGYEKRLAEFLEYHREHPEVYRELCRRSRLMIARGASFSIRTLWEAMRWDFWLYGPTPTPYKMNDHHTPFYARILMAVEPDLAGIFETRNRKKEPSS